MSLKFALATCPGLATGYINYGLTSDRNPNMYLGMDDYEDPENYNPRHKKKGDTLWTLGWSGIPAPPADCGAYIGWQYEPGDGTLLYVFGALSYPVNPFFIPQGNRAPWTSTQVAAAACNLTLGALHYVTNTITFAWAAEAPGPPGPLYHYRYSADRAAHSLPPYCVGTEDWAETEAGNVIFGLAGVKYINGSLESRHITNGGAITAANANTKARHDITNWLKTYLDNRNNYSGFDFFYQPETLTTQINNAVGDDLFDRMMRLYNANCRDQRTYTYYPLDQAQFPTGTVQTRYLYYDPITVSDTLASLNLSGWTLPATSRVGRLVLRQD